MKEITVADCTELREKFLKYCDTAEQHQFPFLAMVNIRLDTTIDKIKADGKVIDQKDTRAMFRVILKIIGEECTEYEETKN